MSVASVSDTVSAPSRPLPAGSLRPLAALAGTAAAIVALIVVALRTVGSMIGPEAIALPVALLAGALVVRGAERAALALYAAATRARRNAVFGPRVNRPRESQHASGASR